MSQRYMVLTAVGTDRPGLVKEVSSIIHDAGCNIEDSRMAILAGEFALILLFSGPADEIERINAMLSQRMQDELGYCVTLKESRRTAESSNILIKRLRVSGADRAGIVHRISEVVAELGINVASLESRLDRAPFSGTPLFNLDAELQLSDSAMLERLEAALARVCDELDLSYALET